LLAPSPDDVFINCPFDQGYARSFSAIVFTIIACGFTPRNARELDDGVQSRLDKIVDLIRGCRYGIHDLSRTEPDPVHGLPRFNMPFELGLFLAARKFGGKAQSTKRALVFDIEPYRYQKFISDLNGIDVTAHNADPEVIVAKVRNWLANVSRRRIAGERIVVEAFNRFALDLPARAAGAGFDPEAIPYVDFEYLVTDWLLSEPIKR
jgi:hypothetical protein